MQKKLILFFIVVSSLTVFFLTVSRTYADLKECNANDEACPPATINGVTTDCATFMGTPDTASGFQGCLNNFQFENGSATNNWHACNQVMAGVIGWDPTTHEKNGVPYISCNYNASLTQPTPTAPVAPNCLSVGGSCIPPGQTCGTQYPGYVPAPQYACDVEDHTCCVIGCGSSQVGGTCITLSQQYKSCSEFDENDEKSSYGYCPGTQVCCAPIPQPTVATSNLPCAEGLDASGNHLVAIDQYGNANPTIEPSIVQCTKIYTGVGPINLTLSDFIANIVGIVLSLAGGIALLLIIASGYNLALSQGNPEKIKEARERLTAAIIGLLFIIFSGVLLQIIGVNILGLVGFK